MTYIFKCFSYQMDVPLILASVGATLSTISNIPQVWKVRNSHSTDDLHAHSVIIHMIAALTWSMYGFMLDLYILGIESFIVFLLYSVIMTAIIRDRYICPKTEES